METEQKWTTFPLKVCIFFNNKDKEMVAVSSAHRHVLMVKKQCFGNILGPEWKRPGWVPRKCLGWWTGSLVSHPFSAFSCSEVWASFPEAALSAMHGSHQCNSQGWHAAGFPCFDFWMDSTFLSSIFSFLFFFWLTQNGCRCGKHMLKVTEYYFHPEEKPDTSSFRLCEFLVTQWPSNTATVARDNRL